MTCGLSKTLKHGPQDVALLCLLGRVGSGAIMHIEEMCLCPRGGILAMVHPKFSRFSCEKNQRRLIQLRQEP